MKPMDYDDKATERLQRAMELSAGPRWGQSRIGQFWDPHISTSEMRKILKSMLKALEDGADPNPIPDRSLLAVLCACPLGNSKALLDGIKMAVAAGVDISTPLFGIKYLDGGPIRCRTVWSPLKPLLHTRFLQSEDTICRFNAAFSGMKREQLQEVFVPRVRRSAEMDIVVEQPLLCSFSRMTGFNILSFLLDFAEKHFSRAVLNTIVNEPIRVTKDGAPFDIQELCRQDKSYEIVDTVGNTPLHHLFLTFGDRPLSNIVKRFEADGAKIDGSNALALSPHMLAWTTGKWTPDVIDASRISPVAELSE